MSAAAEDAEPEVGQNTKRAVEILAEEAGTPASRARNLIDALGQAYTREGLEIVLGTWPVAGGALDQRVARLDALLDALKADEAPPTPYELGAMFRITPTQAGSVMRTYQARFGPKLRARMRSKITAAVDAGGPSGDDYEFPFNDRATLDFAADYLRRQGLSRGLKVDSVELTLTIPTKLTDNADRDAVEILKHL